MALRGPSSTLVRLIIVALSFMEVSGRASPKDPVEVSVFNGLRKGESTVRWPRNKVGAAAKSVPLPVLPEPPVPGNVTETQDPITDDITKDPLHSDIFSRRPGNKVLDQHHLLKAAPLDEWLVLGCTVVALLVFDAIVLQRVAVSTFGCNVALLSFWILVGFGYNAYFAARYGGKIALDWTTGYFLEWLLSMDNLFVFHLIFKTYRTPLALQPMALFYGIVGAIVLRIFFFLFIGELINMVHWLRFVFGALLVYSGIEAATSDDDDEEDVEDTMAVRFLKYALGSRLIQKYDVATQRLFIIDGGVRKMTLLMHVILCLWVCDVIFAVDSVSAKVAQIPNQYVAYSSSVFAMFGLRAMFVIIKDLVEIFELLKYGICIILCFIGFQLMLADYIHLDSATVCFVIMSVFMVCIMGSVVKDGKAAHDASSMPTPRRDLPTKESSSDDTDPLPAGAEEVPLPAAA